MRKTAVFTRLVAALIALSTLTGTASAADAICVFAAASLRNAIDELDTAYSKATGLKVTASYAASSALVKQIEQGAPADVVISADIEWMDYAAAHKLIKADTRVNLLGNSLVLVAAKDSRLGPVDIARGFDIAKLAGGGRIAVANVQTVPAGRYAREALQALGAWAAAEPKLAMAENVRAALAYVARGETAIGIVYATDAKAEPGVKVIGTLPESSHPPVIYPVAATVAAKPGAARYLDFLRTNAAKAIFERYGFSFLIKPVS